MTVWPTTNLLLGCLSLLTQNVNPNELCDTDRWNVVEGDWIDLGNCAIQNICNSTCSDTDILWFGSSNGQTRDTYYDVDSFKMQVEFEINSDEGNAGILFRAWSGLRWALYIAIYPSLNEIQLTQHKYILSADKIHKRDISDYDITPNTKYILTIDTYGPYTRIKIDNDIVFEKVVSAKPKQRYGTIGYLTHNASATLYSITFTKLINVNAGYCNPFKPHHFIEIISIIISIICLFMILLICIISYKYMDKNNPTKYLYYLCLFVCGNIMIITTIETIICVYILDDYTSIIRQILVGIIWIMYIFILITYIARIYYAFKGSEYALNKNQMLLFIAILTVLILAAIGAFIIMNDETMEDQQDDTMMFYLGIIGVFVYFVTALYAVLLFVTKLLKLLVSTNINRNDMPLHQKQIIQYVSRHLTVLALVIFTDILSYTMIGLTFYFLLNRKYRILSIEEMDQISMIFVCIDAAINMLSLFVTFKFANQYYQKYCKCWILCCNRIFTQKLKEIIIEKYKEMNYDRIAIQNRDFLSNTVESENKDIDVLRIPELTETSIEMTETGHHQIDSKQNENTSQSNH